jgi:sodium transport system permease protein
VLGKWGAVAAVGIGVAVLSAFSFLPGQWLLRSETLASLLRYGPVEAMWFVALLLPLALAAAALLMAVAIRSRSVKEAQASATLVVFAVSLLPLATLFGTRGDQAWHLWVPGLAQSTLMTRVLRGEAPGAPELLVPLGVGAGVAALALLVVARALRGSALR